MAVVHTALCDTEAELHTAVAKLRRRPDVILLGKGGIMPGGHKWWQKYREIDPEPDPEHG
jgi:hypothetical protein